jgi:hypothetical protein
VVHAALTLNMEYHGQACKLGALFGGGGVLRFVTGTPLPRDRSRRTPRALLRDVCLSHVCQCSKISRRASLPHGRHVT